jgi:phosphoenolpyruvate carboxykinase (ATP)
MRTDPVFGLEVPREVPGVDGRLLDPRSTWAESEAHDAGARELVELFRRNFEQFADVDPDVASAGPVLRG